MGINCNQVKYSHCNKNQSKHTPMELDFWEISCCLNFFPTYLWQLLTSLVGLLWTRFKKSVIGLHLLTPQTEIIDTTVNGKPLAKTPKTITSPGSPSHSNQAFNCKVTIIFLNCKTTEKPKPCTYLSNYLKISITDFQLIFFDHVMHIYYSFLAEYTSY